MTESSAAQANDVNKMAGKKVNHTPYEIMKGLKHEKKATICTFAREKTEQFFFFLMKRAPPQAIRMGWEEALTSGFKGCILRLS